MPTRRQSVLKFALGLVLLSCAGTINAGAPGLNERPVNLTCITPDRPPTGASIAFEEVAVLPGHGGAGTPTAMRFAPGDDTIWYIARGKGIIERWQNGATFAFLGNALDIKAQTAHTFDGGNFSGIGLVGLAFHPDFQANGEVFVYYGYTPNLDNSSPPLFMRLSRFRSFDNGVTFDPVTEEVLLSTEQFSSQHKGGNLEFGDDGYLYVGLGDDLIVSELAQDLNSHKGKMLRIDVDAGAPYGIPPDNPLVGGQGLPEIYAWGLRQPWRWTFDSATGAMMLGDVGSQIWEEVNSIVKGGNYGWPFKEGFACLVPEGCDNPDLIDPIVVFPNEGPTSVIGGYVYRGTAIPELDGTYIYADGRKAVIYGLFYDEFGDPDPQILLDPAPLVNSFSVDPAGEIYALSPFPIAVYKIVPAGEPPPNTFPQLLSETGCTDPLDTTLPAAGLIPYGINSPLWSDNAEKGRWIALPDWSVGDKEIHIEADGDFTFPIGTVLVKSFSIEGELAETRLFMRHDDGGWAGYSYEWNNDGTDATLLAAGKTKMIGEQQWTYPSRNQCLQCHSGAAGRSIGPEIAQLNGDITYPETGLTANQLTTLDHIGVFDTALPGPVSSLDRLPPPFDSQEPLDLRARGYLHANCSMCHRPGGPGLGAADFRYWIAGTSMGVLNMEPAQGDIGVPGAKVLLPGHPELSVISLRMHDLGLYRMPPLGTSIVDTAGTDLIDNWILSGLGFGETDTDTDGFADNVDNCILLANPAQDDTDKDGLGNACDPDIAVPNDCLVNFADLEVFKAAFFSTPGAPNWNPDADMTADDIVNFQDLEILKDFFFTTPGPSGLTDNCD